MDEYHSDLIESSHSPQKTKKKEIEIQHERGSYEPVLDLTKKSDIEILIHERMPSLRFIEVKERFQACSSGTARLEGDFSHYF